MCHMYNYTYVVFFATSLWLMACHINYVRKYFKTCLDFLWLCHTQIPQGHSLGVSSRIVSTSIIRRTHTRRGTPQTKLMEGAHKYESGFVWSAELSVLSLPLLQTNKPENVKTTATESFPCYATYNFWSSLHLRDSFSPTGSVLEVNLINMPRSTSSFRDLQRYAISRCVADV